MVKDAVGTATGARECTGERQLLHRRRCPGLSDTQWGDRVAPREPLVGGGESETGANRDSDGGMDETEGQASGGEAEEEVEAERPPDTDGVDDGDAAITSVEPPLKYHASWQSWQEYIFSRITAKGRCK
ncbi:hypothetical protein DVH05_016032 [Phytophthora capsici]|nr:hypothetical protein DVH05_016032 [Phytophthora capsici]